MTKYLQESRAYLGSGLKDALLRYVKEKESRGPNLEIEPSTTTMIMDPVPVFSSVTLHGCILDSSVPVPVNFNASTSLDAASGYFPESFPQRPRHGQHNPLNRTAPT